MDKICHLTTSHGSIWRETMRRKNIIIIDIIKIGCISCSTASFHDTKIKCIDSYLESLRYCCHILGFEYPIRKSLNDIMCLCITDIVSKPFRTDIRKTIYFFGECCS